MDVEYAVKQMLRNTVDFVGESGTRGVVIGISGGVDSAVVLRLCQKALIPNNFIVYTAYFPDKYSSEENRETVDKLVRSPITCNHYEINIDPMVEAFTKSYNDGVKNLMIHLTEANLRSRIRMCLLYMISNDHNLLVAGTTNRTEMSIGYYTKYGDGGVDFEPIGSLYKDEVYEVARYLEIPEEVITKPPSAGLWEGQTDEDELGMDYPTLDRILRFMERPPDPDRITKLQEDGLGPSDVKKVKDMMIRNLHKTGPGFKSIDKFKRRS